MRDKSISKTIPCSDLSPSYQPTSAALTTYIIKRRPMAMVSLEQIRDKNHTNPFKQHSHVINRIEQHLHAKLSEEYGLQWTAGKK